VEQTAKDVRRIDDAAPCTCGASTMRLRVAQLWRWSALMCTVELTPTDLRVVRRDDLQEFHLLAGDDVVSVMGFEQRGGTVVVLHTATPEPMRHRGYASTLVERALAELERDGAHVTVRCPFVRWWQSTTAPRD
jgi:predicted GNAT family acetyltransferase